MIKQWWRSLDTSGKNAFELPQKTVVAFMIKKRLAQDK